MSDMDHLIIMRPYPNGKYQYVIYHKDSIPALRDCCLVSCTFDIFQPDTFNILEPDGLVVVYKLLMSTTPNNITWIDEFTGYNINNIIHIESNHIKFNDGTIYGITNSQYNKCYDVGIVKHVRNLKLKELFSIIGEALI